MPEPRLFYASWGTVGGRDKASDPGELFTVRRAAMAIALTLADQYRNKRPKQLELAGLLDEVRADFLHAETGTLMFGYTVMVEVGGGSFYIAVTPNGKRFRDNQTTNTVRVGQMNKLHRTPPVSSAPTRSGPLTTGPPRSVPGESLSRGLSKRARQKEAEVSVGRRIGQQMAKAAREAVENGDDAA